MARALNAEAYQYSTPEQLLGEPLDARSDMYAFGIMLFEMLAGERPYIAEGSDELAEKIKAGAPKLLIPGAYSHTLRFACAKFTEFCRYSSCPDRASIT